MSRMNLVDLLALASVQALRDAGVLEKRREIVDQVLAANMGACRINARSSIASSLVSRIGLESCMAETVENGPASGASAVKLGVMAIQSGMVDTVLVTGGEMMNAVSRWVGIDFVSTMLHHEAEYVYGMTLPAFAALFTRMYMHRYGLSGRELAMVAVKNHENAAKNPYAHLKNPCTLEAIYDGENAHTANPVIADPLRLYDVCPVSDGAASLLLCAEDSPKMRLFKKEPIVISGIASATDTHCVHMRKDPLILGAVRLAAERAYAMARLTPGDISFAELHDAFVILELAISEEVGFFERGQARFAMAQGQTQIGGSLPINTSGGLKAKGHPLGATGVSQIYELVKQLRGDAEPGRRVQSPKHGMAVNFGGFGNNIVVTICSRAGGSP
jgi:acetyl-CoA C-acetyltransferase